jgi:prepilin peptidase CpaA
MELLSAQHIVVLLLVTVAAAIDVAEKRIPNWLTYTGAALGFGLGVTLGGWGGLADAGLGFLVGFLPLLLMYAGGGLGAGDVKLMGAVGSLLGMTATINALLACFIAGGFFAAIILLWQGRLFALLKYLVSRMWSLVYRPHVPEPLPEYKDSFPFGVAIAAGVYITLAAVVTGAGTPGQLLG